MEGYIDNLKDCEERWKTLDNCYLQNAFMYGQWLQAAFDLFTKEKKRGRLDGNFKVWITSKCNISVHRVKDFRKFYNQFRRYSKVLKCKLSLKWFLTHGTRIIRHFIENPNIACKWL